MSDLPTYKAWKQSIPFLYDWFANHHLDWPSLACRHEIISEATQALLRLAV